jgi:hypothetical protein
MTGAFKCARLSDGKKAAIVSVLVLAALMIGLVLSVAACGGGGLEGTWVSEKDGETVVITADKISVESESTGKLEFTYKVDGDQLLLSMEGLATDMPATYKLDGDTLTISSDGEDSVYTRK